MSAPAVPAPEWRLRRAGPEDATALGELIRLSVHGLQSSHYSVAQREAALGPVFGVDHQLIADGTYFVAVAGAKLVAAGGWSRRAARFGGSAGRPDSGPAEWLDPGSAAARIRAFFVHPDWARRGLGRALLARCESEIQAAGFRSAEIVATLAGEPLYAAGGYRVTARTTIALPDGLALPVVHMMSDWSGRPAETPAGPGGAHP